MRRHLTVLVAAAAVLATAAPAASAATETETASSGPVTATFTYRKARDFTFSDLALKIERNGVVAVDGPIDSAVCEGFCAPGGAFFGEEPSVKVADLDGDGEP
jgi:hypothetical protein